MYLKTAGCERIKRDYNKKSERYWDDEIYHQRSAKKSRVFHTGLMYWDLTVGGMYGYGSQVQLYLS
jgi:hypothetical protein